MGQSARLKTPTDSCRRLHGVESTCLPLYAREMSGTPILLSPKVAPELRVRDFTETFFNINIVAEVRKTRSTPRGVIRGAQTIGLRVRVQEGLQGSSK